jgi:hypothetical protein
MRFFMGLVLALALGVMGCSETTGTGGSGGGGVECEGTVCPCNEAGIRDAIAKGGGPYTFACGGPGTLVTVVTDAEFELDQDVILDGEGYLTVRREAGPNDEYEEHEVFGVADGVTAELRGFTVSQISGDEIAGIRNLGTLTLAGSAVLMGVDNPGTLTMMNSSASEISNAGTLTMTNSDTSGISNAGSMTLTRSDVSAGSGIVNTGSATLEKSTVEDNEGWPAGGVLNSGTLAVIDSTIQGNRSFCDEFEEGCGVAGVVNAGTMTLINSTLASNENELGKEPCSDLANNGGTATLTNSTLSGADICNDEGGTLTMSHCTLLLDEALRTAASSTTALGNSVVAGECVGDGVITSNGYNVESPNDTCGFDAQQDDLVSVTEEELNLDGLSSHGGPTATNALSSPSVAIDLIPTDNCVDADGVPLATDQRGEPRPYGEACDVGAVEWQPGDPTGIQ